MRRPVIIASILLLALACDKPKEEVDPALVVPLTDMSRASAVLFQVYGARDEPKAAPIAAMIGGTPEPINLDADGWRALDSAYFSPGNRLPMYRDGADVGSVEIVRGMWGKDEPLYTLPGCREVVPQAEVRLQATIPTEESVEFLASSAPMVQPKRGAPLPADASLAARTVANAVASSRSVGREELEKLDFISRWLRTGAGPTGRTLLASYIDPNAGDAGPGAGHTTMILALAEDSAGTQNTSYAHFSNGEGRTVDFQRVANHVDLDGDGVDEIIVEQWRYAGVPDLLILKYRGGKWEEIFRKSMEWCLSKKADGKR